MTNTTFCSVLDGIGEQISVGEGVKVRSRLAGAHMGNSCIYAHTGAAAVHECCWQNVIVNPASWVLSSQRGRTIAAAGNQPVDMRSLLALMVRFSPSVAR